MQQKLKSILHSASKRKSSSPEYTEDTARYYDENNLYPKEHYTSTTDQSHYSYRNSHQSGRSRPLTLIHANLRSGGTQPVTGNSNGNHEEHIADRNTNQYNPASYASRQRSIREDGPTGNTLPHRDVTPGRTSQWEKTVNPARTEHYEHEKRLSETGNSSSQARPAKSIVRQVATISSQEQSAEAHTASAGSLYEVDKPQVTSGSEELKVQQRSLLDGVLDLNNTVDTDKVTHFAPAVTHEVIKPHEHEIIQHRIYREIHNYSYYHRLQPVVHTEVLPPRHFIPNPHGEGLIEISADEVPGRTGKNRWWDVVQREIPPPSVPNNSHRWRTEPESIESAPYFTEEGFERKETTIVYPPTLEDLSSYSGVVQPIHFDHKTGQRWLGDITTMDKLREGLQHLSHQRNSSELPPSPTIKRKPVNGSTEGESDPRLGVTS